MTSKDLENTAIKILQVDPQTAGLLENVAPDVFDHEISSEHLEPYLALPHAVMFVGVSDQCVIAQVRGIIHYQPDGPAELYIDNLGITPSMKRRGIATRLLGAITEWARGKGCTAFWLLTEPENEEGQSFYSSLGIVRKTSLFFEGEI